MKIGTLKCKLFGHKFLLKSIVSFDIIYKKVAYIPTDHCVRCGITREELKNEGIVIKGVNLTEKES